MFLFWKNYKRLVQYINSPNFCVCLHTEETNCKNLPFQKFSTIKHFRTIVCQDIEEKILEKYILTKLTEKGTVWIKTFQERNEIEKLNEELSSRAMGNRLKTISESKHIFYGGRFSSKYWRKKKHWTNRSWEWNTRAEHF